MKFAYNEKIYDTEKMIFIGSALSTEGSWTHDGYYYEKHYRKSYYYDDIMEIIFEIVERGYETNKLCWFMKFRTFVNYEIVYKENFSPKVISYMNMVNKLIEGGYENIEKVKNIFKKENKNDKKQLANTTHYDLPKKENKLWIII